jgi:hypothetical protein
MGIVATKAISAENQWSDVFELQGDSGHIPSRRALVNATRDDSTVTLRRYAAATDAVDAYLSSLDLDSTMSAVEIPVGGLYRVGVATGNYGGTALTITVEQ